MSTEQATPAASPAPPVRPARLPRRRRAVYLVIACIALACGIIYGVRYYQHAEAYESTDDAFIDGHIIRVSPRVPGKVVRVLINDNEDITEADVRSGKVLVEIDPRDYQFRVDQARAAVATAESQVRTAEQNLAVVRGASAASIQQAQGGVDQAVAGLAMARSQVDVARGQLARAEAHVTVSRAMFEQAKASAAAAAAEAKRTDDDMKRYAELFEAKRISQQQMDAAATGARAAAEQFKAAKGAVAAAEAGITESEAARKSAADSVKLAEDQVPQADAKIAEYKGRLDDARLAPQRVAVAQAQLETANAEVTRLKTVLAQAELELSYTKIVAPEAGYVTKKSVEAGQFFQPGQAMFALVPANVWVTANLKETALARIRPRSGDYPGQEVEVAVDAYPGKVFKGHVDSVQAGSGAAFSLLPPENATGNFVKVVQRVPVKITLDDPPDPNYRLSPGMSVVPEVRVK
jgi:membrane fusion protein (multidrug efflux system)